MLHSHAYPAAQQLRRCFDEWRGLLEVYGWRAPARPARLARQLAGELRRTRGELAATETSAAAAVATLAGVSRHHVARLVGATLGSHADRLPPAVRRRLSLERRGTFEPLTPHTRT